MQIIVTNDHRFCRTPDGSVWTATNHAYSFWTRYLNVFDGVKVVARMKAVLTPPVTGHRADGEGVSFSPVPHFLGPIEYIVNARAVRRAVRSALRVEEAVIMRVGSQIANCLEPALTASGHPFGLEVIGDPFEMFSRGVVRHPLRPFFRWWFPRRLRSQCESAIGVSYVTDHSLQQRYPCRQYRVGMSDVELDDAAILNSHNSFETSYSSVELSDKDTIVNPRFGARQEGAIRLISVGTLEQPYKGMDVLIKAVHSCRSRGADVTLEIVGDGQYRGRLEALAESLHMGSSVTFRGNVASGDAVRDLLDESDIFVLASRTEGLPRAVIEAMARGLPCISTSVGGIPELLPPEDMVSRDNFLGLAQKIMEVASSQERMFRMSARNLERSQDFRREVLERRRHAFYSHIREVTADWIQRRSS